MTTELEKTTQEAAYQALVKIQSPGLAALKACMRQGLTAKRLEEVLTKQYKDSLVVMTLINASYHLQAHPELLEQP